MRLSSQGLGEMKGLIERQELELIRLRAEAENQVQWVRDLADNLIAEEAKTATLRARIAQLEVALREFCDRVDRGEVKSVTTYAKFKALLEDRT